MIIPFFVCYFLVLIFVVRDIPSTAKETDLLAFFLPCGNIISLKFDIHHFWFCRLSKRDDNELNNGYGFVEFSTSEECKKSIQHCKHETFNEIRLTGELLSSLMESNEDNVMGLNELVL